MMTINSNSSKPSILCFGVPQGSVVGPVLFILCTKPLSDLIERHSISNQSFADDTQLLDSCPPDHLDTTVLRMQNCISEVNSWMDCSKLKLNDDKTESFLTKWDRIMLPDSAPTSIRVGNWHCICFSCKNSWDHNLIQHNHRQAYHKHLQIRLRWTAALKLRLSPSDSQCNQNSPLCLCSLKVRLLQLPPLWLSSIHCGQASKSTKFCSKISNEIPQVWSCTASFVQPTPVTSPHKDWLQNFNPVLQHVHRLFSRLYRSASIRPHPFQTAPFNLGHTHPAYSFHQN